GVCLSVSVVVVVEEVEAVAVASVGRGVDEVGSSGAGDGSTRARDVLEVLQAELPYIFIVTTAACWKDLLEVGQ
ncbi:MAG: hypothetical protein MJE68_06985, partial [Proteobacteria bacterium]|nr:hypothetical protein [Pseudomonadota bacterium]